MFAILDEAKGFKHYVRQWIWTDKPSQRQLFASVADAQAHLLLITRGRGHRWAQIIEVTDDIGWTPSR